MAEPGLSLDEIEFDEPDDPELRELLDPAPAVAGTSDSANADLLDPPAEPEPAPADDSAEISAGRPAKVHVLDTVKIEGDPNAGEPSFMERAGQRIKTGAVETGKDIWDTLAGVGQGVTLGWGEQLAAAITPEYDDGTGIPKTYAAGSAYKDMRDQNRQRIAESKQRSPWLYGGGEALGTAATAVLTAPVMPGATGARAAQLGTRVAQNMAQGAITGGIAGGGYSEADTAQGVAQDALTGVEWGALAGGGVTAAAGAAAPLARKAQATLGKAADYVRGSAVGAYGSQLSQLAEQKGPEYIRQLGQAAERLGIKKRLGIPQGAGTYAKEAERVTGELGETIGQSLDEFGNLNVRAPKNEVIERVLGTYRTHRAGVTDTAAAKAKATDRALRRVSERYGDELTPRELWGLKKEFEAEAGFKPGQLVTRADSARAQSARDVASDFRSLLDESIQKQVDIPELTGRYEQAMGDYGLAADIGKLSQKRFFQELGNQPVSLTGAAMTGGGGLAAVPVWEAVKRYGKDAAADVLRGGERMARGVGGALEGLSQAPVGAASGYARAATLPARQMTPSAAPAFAGDPQQPEQQGSPWAALTQKPYASAQQEETETVQGRKRIADHARGHELADVVRRALQENPQALGDYAQRLAEAAEGESANLAAAIDRFSREPQFRETVLPALQQMTTRRQ